MRQKRSGWMAILAVLNDAGSQSPPELGA